MSLAPSPSSSRGEIILQPGYFTSSAFVDAARADVDYLVQEYSRRYARSTPFALFKTIWQGQGWTWIQFKVFDARSRASFLRVTMRLLLERINASEPPLTRAAALFGLYTIYHTQLSTSTPPLYSAPRVEMAWDVYREMLMLPDALNGEHLHPVRPHVIYVQSELLRAQVFHVLPHGGTHPLSPRILPREVVRGDEDGNDGNVRRKRGRPCRRDRLRKARARVAALEEGWKGDSGAVGVTRAAYEQERSVLLDVCCDELSVANAAVVERIEMITKT